MSLKFYFGASGAGKSQKLHQDIITRSLCAPNKLFLFIVPDQFTMHTQMELVKAHPRHGILNIDVLSFGRLAHRIFEEVGGNHRKVLDDTGKSLVLRKVAANIREELPVIGPNLHKPGYIAEVKSAVSEFMQYGIGPEELNQLTQFAVKKKALAAKLTDLNKLYSAFLAYLKQEYITTEETLDLLRASLHKSPTIKNSVIIFDGFTGFTPIQNRVIQELMTLADQVILSVLIGAKTDPFETGKEQELFYLSRKTVADLCRLAKETGTVRENDEYLRADPPPRFAGNSEMAHLEKSLFRYPITEYQPEKRLFSAPELKSAEADIASKKATLPTGSQAIFLSEAATVAEEVRQACMKIKELTLDQGFLYRDIAVVTGDMNAYAGYMEREAAKYGIPLFMDRTRGILLNPFTEFIRSALKVVIKNFSYETVFHYLRSGFVDCDPDEIDRLENYVIACGIRGRKKWRERFTRRSRSWGGEQQAEQQAEKLAQLNATREKVISGLEPLENRLATAGEMIQSLYDFIVASRIQQKLAVYEEYFTKHNDHARAREFGQIYRLVMELLDQVYGLLAEEKMSLTEFAEILDAGLGEIEVGIIPQNVDRVVVGDIERTRLNHIKVLLFLGVNDGNIPGSSGKGGLISDLDREFLKDSQWELAPTPRQQMYIQRLYLYMNMTKPSQRLYLSYARISSEGKSRRPSYLVEVVRKLFPLLEVTKLTDETSMKQVYGINDSWDLFAASLRDFASGRRGDDKNKLEMLAILGRIYRKEAAQGEKLDQLLEAAFVHYLPHPLSRQVADALYGSMLEYSVSRLERYAACAYAHFLQYGLALREREEYGFEAVDLGNVFHGVLELFAGKLAEQHISWFDFAEETGRQLLWEALQAYAAEYGDTVLFSSARNEQMIRRIYRILARTVKILQQQLQKGSFVPERFEVAFSGTDDLDAVDIALSEQEKIKLRGRIDRIDTCEDEEHVYVKVVDYKSGTKRFDLAAFYYGLQLQLVVYMNVAMEMTGKSYPDKKPVPAALLYYHVADPMIADGDGLTPEEINQLLLQELRTTGAVNEREEVIALLDRDFTARSLVVPVERKKDGSFSRRSGVMSEADFQTISSYVNHKIRQFGQEIKDGQIVIEPYESKDGQACTYCSFKGICGYDEKIPGYRHRKLPDLDRETVMERMEEEIGSVKREDK